MAEESKGIAVSVRSRLLTLLAAVFFIFAALAQSAPAQTIKFYRKAPTWTEIPGRSVDIGISSGGIVYAIARNGRIWRWGSTLGEEWRRMPGKGFRRVDVDGTNKPWAVTAKGDLMFYNGLWWEKRGAGFKEVGAGGRGTVIALDSAGNLYRWNRKKKIMEPYLAAKAVRVDVDQNGHPWIIDAAGVIYRYGGDKWRRVPGAARDIGIGPNGAIYAAMADGTLSWWEPAEGAWKAFPKLDTVGAVSIGPGGKPWVVLADGKVLASDLFQRQRKEAKAKPKRPVRTMAGLESRRKSARDPALSTSNEPITFTKVNGKAYKIAIGLDGSVYALTTDGKLSRWSNGKNKFLVFPGTLSEIAVTPRGYPLGINRNRDIFYHDGKNWTYIRGSKAKDIAIGPDGTLVISDTGEVIKRKASGNTFLRHSGKGRRVAVGPGGSFWTVRETGAIFRCNVRDECKRIPGRAGKEIGVGPDGSVFMISPDSKLYRFDKRTSEWKRVTTPKRVIDVAVGPKGRPWIVDVKNNVYAANFFKRDESRDAAVALGTSRQTSVITASTASTTTTITFTKNIQFEKITFDSTPASTDYIGAGIDGSVYVLGDQGGAPKIYDEKQKILKALTFSLPASPTAISADADGRIWMIGPVADDKVYHQKKKDGSSFQKYTLTTNSTGQTPDLAMGGDGSVFVVARDNIIYKFNESKNKFEKFDNKANYTKVAVTPDGRPWIIESDHDVKEYDGKAFVKPGGRSQTALDIAIGANGSLYIIDFDNSKIKKWNATSQKFDNVNISGTGVQTSADNIAVQADGRPWYLYTSGSDKAFRARK